MDEHLNNSLLTRIAWLYYYEDKTSRKSENCSASRE